MIFMGESSFPPSSFSVPRLSNPFLHWIPSTNLLVTDPPPNSAMVVHHIILPSSLHLPACFATICSSSGSQYLLTNQLSTQITSWTRTSIKPPSAHHHWDLHFPPTPSFQLQTHELFSFIYSITFAKNVPHPIQSRCSLPDTAEPQDP